MSSRTRFVAVLSDAACSEDFEAICASAGFNEPTATQLAGLYAGPSARERQAARSFADRLWQPVVVEPRLAPADDGESRGPWDPESAAGSVLEIARRHIGARVVLVLSRANYQRVLCDLNRLAGHRLQLAAGSHIATHEFGLRAIETFVVGVEADGNLFGATPSVGRREAELLSWLKERGAGQVSHPGGTLLSHLLGTARILRQWRSPPELVIAGLGHASYGTDGFAPALIGTDARASLARVVGARSEAIIYAYASCDRVFGYPTAERPLLRDRFTKQYVPTDDPMLQALSLLVCANELDLALHRRRHSEREITEAVWAQCAVLDEGVRQVCADRVLDLLFADGARRQGGA